MSTRLAISAPRRPMSWGADQPDGAGVAGDAGRDRGGARVVRLAMVWVGAAGRGEAAAGAHRLMVAQPGSGCDQGEQSPTQADTIRRFRYRGRLCHPSKPVVSLIWSGSREPEGHRFSDPTPRPPTAAPQRPPKHRSEPTRSSRQPASDRLRRSGFRIPTSPRATVTLVTTAPRIDDPPAPAPSRPIAVLQTTGKSLPDRQRRDGGRGDRGPGPGPDRRTAPPRARTPLDHGGGGPRRDR